ncbi:MAG TPA: hypothetical protein VKS21_09290, partial [Spirochaetota bacterium]|nr:hypothetical protein [Spirochaetota bacterium]
WSTNGTDWITVTNSTPQNIIIDQTTTIQVFGNDGMNNSGTNSYTYTFDNSAPSVSLFPSGSFVTNQSFTLDIAVDDDYGYWSTNGTDWYTVTNGNPQNITIDHTTTIRVFGDDSFNNSGTNSFTYTFDTNAPNVTLNPAGSFTTNQPFTLNISVDQDFGYWSTNGTDWNTVTNGAPQNITINHTATIQVFGDDSLNNSGTNAFTYTFDTNAPVVTLSHPDSFSTNQPFTLNISVDQNFGYWSTNGINWHTVTNGTPQNINISDTTEIIYFGQDPVGNNSGTNTARYTYLNVFIEETATTNIYLSGNHQFYGYASNNFYPAVVPLLNLETGGSNFIITPDSNWTFLLDTTMFSNGAHTCTFTARYPSNTNITHSDTLNLVIDNSLPEVAISKPNSIDPVYNVFEFNGTVFDLQSGISTAFITVSNSNTLILNQPINSSNWTINFDSRAYANGAYIINLTGVNQSGLTNTVSTNFFINNLTFNPMVGPNPYQISAANSPFMIQQISWESEVYIYSVNGNLIRYLNPQTDTLHVDNKKSWYEWNLKNESGRQVAAGVYILIIVSDNKKEKILKKISIIR